MPVSLRPRATKVLVLGHEVRLAGQLEQRRPGRRRSCEKIPPAGWWPGRSSWPPRPGPAPSAGARPCRSPPRAFRRAFLQSIIPAPVFSRSVFTSVAFISTDCSYLIAGLAHHGNLTPRTACLRRSRARPPVRVGLGRGLLAGFLVRIVVGVVLVGEPGLLLPAAVSPPMAAATGTVSTSAPLVLVDCAANSPFSMASANSSSRPSLSCRVSTTSRPTSFSASMTALAMIWVNRLMARMASSLPGIGIGDALGVAVGVHDGDDGHADPPGLGHGDGLLAGVDDEDDPGQLLHLLDAAEVLLQASPFPS